MKKIERRYLPTTEVRFVAEENAEPKIIGYAAVFNTLSEDRGGWREIIRPGAFSQAITNGDDVRALVDHISDKILGRTVSGTLTISEDNKGLYSEIIPPNTQAGRDIVESLKRGDISGMSFQFTVGQGNDKWIKIDGEDVREIYNFEKLYDVSVVTFPAYVSTNAEVRSDQEVYEEHLESLEEGLTDIELEEIQKRNIKQKEYRDRQIDIMSL